MSSELQVKAARAVEALQELRDAALSECGSPAEGGDTGLPAFRLAWEDAMTPAELAAESLRIAAEAVSEQLVVRSGHVYCYACGTAACEHSAPPDPGVVFAGYESTGRPRWEELFNLLLQVRDPRTDLLFSDRSETLARVVGRRRLISDQLASFGKNSLTYRIWGQVVAGYLPLKGMRGALSVQLVETRDHQLHLQVITDLRLLEALTNAPTDKRSPFHRVFDAIVEARRQVFSLSGLWRTTHERKLQHKAREKAFSILRHLAHSIERKGRQQQRRTAHAELRGQENRPVHKAYDDLVRASQADFLSDTVRQSVIVLGRSGRLHAFNQEGRHITSMAIGGDELERRRRRRRYLPLEAGTVEPFRNRAISCLPRCSDVSKDQAS